MQRELVSFARSVALSTFYGADVEKQMRNPVKLGRRGISKDIPLGSSEFRNEQFGRLIELRRRY